MKEVTTVAGLGRGAVRRGVRVLSPAGPHSIPQDDGDERTNRICPSSPGESSPHEPTIRGRDRRRNTEANLLGAMETAGKLVDDEQLGRCSGEGLGTRDACRHHQTLLGVVTSRGEDTAGDRHGPLPVAMVRMRSEEPRADRRVGSEAARDRAHRLTPSVHAIAGTPVR